MAALEQAVWAADAASDHGVLAAAATACAAVLGLPARIPAGAGDPGAGDPTSLAFAEQFSIDVSSTTDEQRAGLVEALGVGTGPFVQGLYVVDFFPRARAALDALFGPPAADRSAHNTTAPPAAGSGPAQDLWGLSMEFLRSVALLGELDPLTAELVRLRGASQHQCRLCKSLRNRTAIEAGGNDDLFAAVDADRAPLSDAQRAALALADAMIWTPGGLDPEVVEAVRRHFSPSAAVALVLWVTRNASNKIAVALAADAAHVTDGIEIYDLDARGEPVYGLTPA